MVYREVLEKLINFFKIIIQLRSSNFRLTLQFFDNHIFAEQEFDTHSKIHEIVFKIANKNYFLEN